MLDKNVHRQIAQVVANAWEKAKYKGTTQATDGSP
jgi:hypothetical protein